uniref:Uncharacterized protein n=1 Tax=Triticum aestivum TaxID=4565 RepID=A0A2Z6ERU2_WHEAT|nr:hypothetical protein [Triticum aestivum]
MKGSEERLMVLNQGEDSEGRLNVISFFFTSFQALYDIKNPLPFPLRYRLLCISEDSADVNALNVRLSGLCRSVFSHLLPLLGLWCCDQFVLNEMSCLCSPELATIHVISVSKANLLFGYYICDICHHRLRNPQYSFHLQENASLFDMLDIFSTAISIGELKKRIHKVENTVSEVKKAPLLCVASNSTQSDIANKNRRRLGAASKREVFGREVLRDDIMARRVRHHRLMNLALVHVTLLAYMVLQGLGRLPLQDMFEITRRNARRRNFSTPSCVFMCQRLSVWRIYFKKCCRILAKIVSPVFQIIGDTKSRKHCVANVSCYWMISGKTRMTNNWRNSLHSMLGKEAKSWRLEQKKQLELCVPINLLKCLIWMRISTWRCLCIMHVVKVLPLKNLNKLGERLPKSYTDHLLQQQLQDGLGQTQISVFGKMLQSLTCMTPWMLSGGAISSLIQTCDALNSAIFSPEDSNWINTTLACGRKDLRLVVQQKTWKMLRATFKSWFHAHFCDQMITLKNALQFMICCMIYPALLEVIASGLRTYGATEKAGREKSLEMSAIFLFRIMMGNLPRRSLHWKIYAPSSSMLLDIHQSRKKSLRVYARGCRNCGYQLLSGRTIMSGNPMGSLSQNLLLSSTYAILLGHIVHALLYQAHYRSFTISSCIFTRAKYWNSPLLILSNGTCSAGQTNSVTWAGYHSKRYHHASQVMNKGMRSSGTTSFVADWTSMALKMKARRKLLKPILPRNGSQNCAWYGLVMMIQGAVQKLKQRYLRACALPWGFKSLYMDTEVQGTQIGWWVSRAVAQMACEIFNSSDAANWDLVLNLRLSLIFVCSIFGAAAGTPCQATWSTSRCSRIISWDARISGVFQHCPSLLSGFLLLPATMNWSLVKQPDIQTGKRLSTSPGKDFRSSKCRTHKTEVPPPPAAEAGGWEGATDLAGGRRGRSGIRWLGQRRVHEQLMLFLSVNNFFLFAPTGFVTNPVYKEKLCRPWFREQLPTHILSQRRQPQLPTRQNPIQPPASPPPTTHRR